MDKIALVTGGTRGIGASISKKLSSNGIKVIANFTSDENSADKFSTDNNIDVVKFDVSSFDECKENVEIIKKKIWFYWNTHK